MAQGYSAETVGALDGVLLPAAKADGHLYRAKIRSMQATLDFSQATVKGNVGDTDVIGKRYAGDLFRGGRVVVSASLGGTTLSVGTAGNPTKYMAATAFTTPNVPVSFATVAGLTDPVLAADETIIVTIGGAAIAAGVAVIHFDTTAR